MNSLLSAASHVLSFSSVSIRVRQKNKSPLFAMKMFSLAAIISAVPLGSNLAFADPHRGPEPFWAHDRDHGHHRHHHHHGGPFIAPFSPLARILPRVVLPAPAIVAPRREVITPVPAPAPLVVPQPSVNPEPVRPPAFSGQGSNGKKPKRPSQITRQHIQN